MKRSELLSALFPDRDAKWQPMLKRTRRPHDIELKNFSLIEAPQQTINLLRELTAAESYKTSVTINFEDQVCLDVSPYLILGLMRPYMAPVIVGGRISPTVANMVDALGLRSFLSISSINNPQEGPTFVPFKIRYRRRAGSTTSQNTAFQPTKAEEIADDLVKTVDGWLAGMQADGLSPDGKHYLCSIVTEPLDNAQRHSDIENQDGDWAVAGFLSGIRKDESDTSPNYFCSLAIVSLGATIAESITQSEDAETKIALKSYIDCHSRTRIERDCLSTVFALQDGVSRFNQGDGRSKGGVGIMDMLEFVDSFASPLAGGPPPVVTIISGRACLSIRPPYTVSKTRSAEAKRELWFNASNSLDKPPDPAYVTDLPIAFPGTVVAIRFYITPGSHLPPAGG